MMEPDASAPDELYYMLRKPGLNITVLPEYRLSKEYPKTHGHFHEPKVKETYEVLMGEAAILIQKGVDLVEEVKLIKLRKGDSFTVPKGYAHSLINLGRGPVVTADDHDPARYTNNYDLIRKRRGFAYYITEEGRKIKAIPNPNYTNVPPLKVND